MELIYIVAYIGQLFSQEESESIKYIRRMHIEIFWVLNLVTSMNNGATIMKRKFGTAII